MIAQTTIGTSSLIGIRFATIQELTALLRVSLAFDEGDMRLTQSTDFQQDHELRICDEIGTVPRISGTHQPSPCSQMLPSRVEWFCMHQPTAGSAIWRIRRQNFIKLSKIITIFGSIGQLHHFHTELQNFQMKIIFWQKVHKYHVVSGKNNENGQNTHADPWDLSDKNAATYFRIL